MHKQHTTIRTTYQCIQLTNKLAEHLAIYSFLSIYYTPEDSRTRGGHIISQIRTTKEVYNNSFFQHSIRDWNFCQTQQKLHQDLMSSGKKRPWHDNPKKFLILFCKFNINVWVRESLPIKKKSNHKKILNSEENSKRKVPN